VKYAVCTSNIGQSLLSCLRTVFISSLSTGGNRNGVIFKYALDSALHGNACQRKQLESVVAGSVEQMVLLVTSRPIITLEPR